MAKFNEVQKKRRALAAERKRTVHGDALTGKLKNKQQPLSISGKRKRKLFKKWRREQKEALQKGLVTMQDVEMAVAEGETGTSEETKKTSTRFHMKKSLRLKQLKRRGGGKKKQSKAKSAPDASVDSMVE
ncbi:uncharacterized protein LOC115744614 isoform X1 [Rhodamnia argentea]|uniref:Uncharacterized protein LOC115744614 n=1 Tax=Rhodamnia argentea TaxID=178133 RepID=A0A8B8PMZ5_9MYRT|nr:uncharacterized protein LOC115744614 isoform X1 [Rhodamnia argentea]XP_048138776.1 uncharacterized protein LOC115744614 isoform X1 [Rhodamnia argentea]